MDLQALGIPGGTAGITARLRQLREEGFILEKKEIAPDVWAYRIKPESVGCGIGDMLLEPL